MAKITVRNNGPYLIEGPVELVDQTGAAYKVEGQKCALCRCGASTKKPFCDGTHNKIAFIAGEGAPKP